MVHGYGPPVIHYGVKGMKWGIRRTPAQLGHVVSSGAKRVKNAVSNVASKRKAKKKREAEVEEDVEQKKERIIKSRSARQLYKNADLFTTQELQNAYNRLNLERNIANIAASEKSAGRRYVDGYINVARKTGDVLQATNKALNQGKAFVRFFTGNNSNSKSSSNSSSKKDSSSSNKSDDDKSRRDRTSGVRSEAQKVANDFIRDISRDFQDLPKALPGMVESGRDWYDEQQRRR